MYDEPAPGSIVAWFKRFEPGGRLYLYVAVHVEGRGWYLTDRYDRALPWWKVAAYHIADSPAFIATGWSPLPRGSTP